MAEVGPDSPVACVRADAVDLPFADATFDAVSCYGALYLMDDPGRGARGAPLRLFDVTRRISAASQTVAGRRRE